MSKRSPFKWFKTSAEIIRLAVMLYVRYPLSPRNVEDLLHQRDIDISHETIRFGWHRFGNAHDLGRRQSNQAISGACGMENVRSRSRPLRH